MTSLLRNKQIDRETARQVKKKQIERQETERTQAELAKQRLADARAMMATEEGRRLLHWFIYDLGGLQKVLPDEPQGRRALATSIHSALDMAEPGSAEELALEARRQRMIDDANIKSAIENRRSEYE